MSLADKLRLYRFMIGGMAMILPFGKIYTLFDVKWVFIVSTVVFMAASALCGGAPSMDAEIIGRVFAGAGGNGMYFGLLALISMNTSNLERPKWLSLR
jgi:MFS family permease